jgi:hypothetical protein
MFHAWKFRILLLAFGLVGVLGFVTDQVDYWTFRTTGTAAMLERASKAAPPGDKLLSDGVVKQSLQVKFKTAAGPLVIVERYVPLDIVARLLKGEQVEIVYLPDNPPRFVSKGEELPLGIGWLLAGLLAIAVFAFSLRLR